MGIVYACIAPHGTELIPKLAGDQLETFSKTRKGMEKLAQHMKKNKPETIIVATPHGLRLDHAIGVVTSEYSEGSLKANRKSVKTRFQCDRQLAQKILQEAKKAKLPVIGANYGTNEGPNSCMPMDWGTLIPLWFFGAHEKKKPKIIIVTPSREIPLAQLVKFGKIIAKTAENSGKRVAFVASADQGHAHKENGPYGFHPASAKFDRLVIQAIKRGDLKSLLRLDKKFIEDAKPDSVWQIAILVGVLECVPMKGRFVSYEAPTYFGMICADFEL
jgi:aromatic ring-opening dioxygenase LigB subunit